MTMDLIFHGAEGVLLVIISQALRSAAMIHASSNFSHTVAIYKIETHRLVTDGVYRYALCLSVGANI